MEFTAKQIAGLIGGRIEGNENAAVHTFAKIEEGQEGAISFLSNPKYTHYLYETKSTIVLINDDVELEHPVSATLIRVSNAYEAVAKLLQFYESVKPKKSGIDSLAFVSPKATIGKDVYIGAFACIGDGAIIGDGTQIYPHTVIGDNVKIGQNGLFYPNVTIYQGCQLGDNVTIHSGSVIGADGFGFAPGAEGYDKIPRSASSSSRTTWRLVPTPVWTVLRWEPPSFTRGSNWTTSFRWPTTAKSARTPSCRPRWDWPAVPR